MNKKILTAFILLLWLATSCASSSKTAANEQKWLENQTVIGTAVTIDAPEQLILLDNKDVLAADGLYYATWGTGHSVPYENSDGDTIDLYDAQIYFLTSETPDEASAEKNYTAWLSAAKENYTVLTEETIDCNGQPYTLITYNCSGGDTPYDRGVSAFGTCGATAVCAELTCLEEYGGDLTVLFTEFLKGCHYRNE